MAHWHSPIHESTLRYGYDVQDRIPKRDVLIIVYMLLLQIY